MRRTTPILALVLVFSALITSAHAQSPDGRKKLAAEIAQIRQDLAKYSKQERELESIKNPNDKQRHQLEETEKLVKNFNLTLGYASAELKKVFMPEDETKGLSNICPVHHCMMKTVIVPIRYGMLMPLDSDPPELSREREFPNARRWRPGGCVSSDFSPTRARIYVCPDCVRAEKQWLRNYEAAHAINQYEARQPQISRPNPHP